MRLLTHFLYLSILFLTLATQAQELGSHPVFPPKEETDHKLPNGKSQNEEILKAEYEKTLKDAADLVEISQALKKELEENDKHVLAISSLRKTEEIEKIAKRIRGRMRRF